MIKNIKTNSNKERRISIVLHWCYSTVGICWREFSLVESCRHPIGFNGDGDVEDDDCDDNDDVQNNVQALDNHDDEGQCLMDKLKELGQCASS